MTQYTRPQAPLPPAAPRGRSTGPRRLAAALLVAPLVALAACSGEEPITATTMAPTTEDVSTTTEGTTSEATTSEATEVTPAPAEASPTTKGLSVQIKDPVLGHVIKPQQMVRNVPWPEGNPVGEASFEIIAIEVEITAGSRYTATLGRGLLRLSTSTSKDTAVTTEFDDLLGKPLPNASRGETTKGWIYYKVDRGSGSDVTLTYKRPEYEVSTTDKAIPAKSFSAKLS